MNERIISIYSSNEIGCASCLVDNVFYEKREQFSREYSQASGFVPLIDKLFKESDFFNNSYKSVIIAPIGPSSFTTARVTLTIAKGLQFCDKEAKIFSPSNFYVVAFSCKDKVSRDKDFLVLLDSLKNGFYGAVFHWGKLENYPKVVHKPAFYDETNCADFLERMGGCEIVTDFTGASFGKKFIYDSSEEINISLENSNLASKQIELYLQSDSKILSEFKEFEPFYLHTPVYTKIHIPS